MNKMRIVAICWGILLVSSMGVRAELVDEVLASVDKEVILRSEIMDEIGGALKSMQASLSDADYRKQANEEIRKAVDQSINNKILLREALLAGVNIEDKMVDKQVEDVKKRYQSAEAFQQAIADAGETPSDFRNRIKKQLQAMSMAMHKQDEFEKQASISESDVAAYYDANKAKYHHSDRVRLQRIFVAPPTSKSARAQAKARLEEVKREVDEGADFGQLAKLYSTAPEAKDGGDMGWVSRGDLQGELDKIVFNLPEGAVSNVIETDYGFHLVKINKKEGEGTLSMEEAKKEIEPVLRSKAGAEKYGKWLADQRKRAQVRIFLKSE